MCLFFGVMLFDPSQSLRELLRYRRRQPEDIHFKQKSENPLRKVLQSLANTKLLLTDERRMFSPSDIAKAKKMVSMLTQKMSNGQLKKLLRDSIIAPQEVVEGTGPEFQIVVEKELEASISKLKSALLDTSYVEKKGQNDFLVLATDVTHVPYIPNNIYYNIEKKCVNWMDDCSLQGIRSKLLQKVKSP